MARKVCLLAPLLLPKPKSTPGEIIGRFASSESFARPVCAARSYQYRAAFADCCAERCRWSDWMNRMETPRSTHSARPCATNRLARFFVVNPQPATGFTILTAFFRVGTILVLMSQSGLRVSPQGNYTCEDLSEVAPGARLSNRSSSTIYAARRRSVRPGSKKVTGARGSGGPLGRPRRRQPGLLPRPPPATHEVASLAAAWAFRRAA